ncbi:MAG: FAD-dependent oxidoreductase [Polyangiaceae bacterium]|nr:FAD-dependent oxidoreductase [Polyangiaceae bacterium]
MSGVWKCEVCGYVHEGEGPPSECPVCGAGAEAFSRMAMEVARVERTWRCTVCGYVAKGEQPPETCRVCGAGAELFELEPAEGDTSVPAASRIVVVGAGIAGTTAVDHARRAAPNAELVLVSAEAALPYYRLNLTRLLAGEIAADALVMAGTEWLATRRVELVQATATALDPEGRRVVLRDGRALAYDRLVLAVGAQPFVPPLAGATLPGVHVLRTLADAELLIERAVHSRTCVVLGGGLLGLETAAAMARRGLAVTVVESQPWLLSRQLTERPARLLESFLARLGVIVRTDSGTRALAGNGRVERVLLEQGGSLEADLVILATGVRPDLPLALAAGLSVGRGLIVDDRMVTSDPNILAAGDIAEHRATVAGIWPVAYAQGRVAGHNAAVGPDGDLALRYAPEPPATRLKVVATTVASMGEFAPTDADAHCLEAGQGDQYVSVVLRGGRVVGANVVGDARLASELEAAIAGGAADADLTRLSEGSALLRAAVARQPHGAP